MVILVNHDGCSLIIREIIHVCYGLSADAYVKLFFRWVYIFFLHPACLTRTPSKICEDSSQ